jgi:hypothetical protein
MNDSVTDPLEQSTFFDGARLGCERPFGRVTSADELRAGNDRPFSQLFWISLNAERYRARY